MKTIPCLVDHCLQADGHAGACDPEPAKNSGYCGFISCDGDPEHRSEDERHEQELQARITQLSGELDKAKHEANNAYAERNKLVALLSRLYPSGIRETAIEGWDPEWNGCVFVDSPKGQLSWHYHRRESFLFEDLPPYEKPWDGHTTTAKYTRVLALMVDADWQRMHGRPVVLRGPHEVKP